MTVAISISLNPSVHTALQTVAAERRMDLNETIQRALTDFAWKAGALSEDDYKGMKMARELVDQAVQRAQEICDRDGFSTDITRKAIKVCTEDPRWVADYRSIVGDDIYRHGNPRKGPINRQIGLRIRLATGARPRIGSNGKPDNVKVTGEIIQSYTPLVRD